jgi:hypothetical protein
MGIEIKKLDEVWTADDQRLGTAQQLFHRIDDADPALQLYATYLGVTDLDYGEFFYVPVDFIADRQPERRRLELATKRAEAMQRTWFRMPNFIAQGKYRQEELPE